MGLVAVHSGAGNSVNEENYRILCKKSSRIACDLLDSGNKFINSNFNLHRTQNQHSKYKS
jgi:hypothetical protein